MRCDLTMLVQIWYDDGQAIFQTDVEAENIADAYREALDAFLKQFTGERHELFTIVMEAGDRAL